MSKPPRKGYRFCKQCKRNRAERFFTPRGRICFPCQKKSRRNYSRETHLMEQWGITLEEYDILLKSQGGVCWICQLPRPYNLDVDHDHDEERALLALGYSPTDARRYSIRGLACKRCNRRLLPAAMNSPEVLLRAASYLRRPWAAQALLNPGELSGADGST